MNKFRLSSNSFERETDAEKINPQKIYFLAVEGNVTEKEYFEGLSFYRTLLGINAKVDVIILNRLRSDNNSAPSKVIELLEEYIQLRNSNNAYNLDIPKEFLDKYSDDFIQKYLNTPEILSKKEISSFLNDLNSLGYDINYRHYLKKYDGDTDEFCILIDRDMHSHSKTNLQSCIDHCKKNNYRFFIANPCFEFWLLLHLSDVKIEYVDKLELIRENPKVSANHTFVSREVSLKAHHGKQGIGFKKNYLPNVSKALLRSKDFALISEELLDNIGCNLSLLIEEMINFSDASTNDTKP